LKTERVQQRARVREGKSATAQHAHVHGVIRRNINGPTIKASRFTQVFPNLKSEPEAQRKHRSCPDHSLLLV
jgi:hypothetical protein